jgi:vancomycin resistance protein VanJ
MTTPISLRSAYDRQTSTCCPWKGRLVGWSLWLYAGGAVLVWAVLRWGGDRWWWATILLFTPRWLWAIPLGVLIPATFLWRRRLWWLAAGTAAWVGGPLMGLCMALPVGSRRDADGFLLRVLTCNIGPDYDPVALARLIIDEDIDVAALQEGVPKQQFLAMLPEPWRVYSSDGISLISKYVVLERNVLAREGSSGGATVAIAFELDTPLRPVDFAAIHLYTPRRGLQAVNEMLLQWPRRMRSNIEFRAQESEAAASWAAARSPSVILAGDFNLPPESSIFRRDWSRYADAFSVAGTGYGYTFGYTSSGWWYGIRIDHILAGDGWRVRRAWLGPHVGADHRPVIAELAR